MQMQAGGDPIPTRSKLGMEEDKQQLSPVSVLDFPFDDDDADERSDAGTCSPSFHHRCPTTPPPDLLLHSKSLLHSALIIHYSSWFMHSCLVSFILHATTILFHIYAYYRLISYYTIQMHT